MLALDQVFILSHDAFGGEPRHQIEQLELTLEFQVPVVLLDALVNHGEFELSSFSIGFLPLLILFQGVKLLLFFGLVVLRVSTLLAVISDLHVEADLMFEAKVCRFGET